MKNEQILYMDHREPFQDLKKHFLYFLSHVNENLPKDRKIVIKVVKAVLDVYDVFFVGKNIVTGETVKVGKEAKRINTGDFEASRNSGHLKEQVSRFRRDVHSHVSFIGNIDDLSSSGKQSLLTLKSEIKAMGAHCDTVKSDRWFMFEMLRDIQVAIGHKVISIDPVCEPVKKDDSLLTKQLKQVKGMGSTDAEYFGKVYNYPLDMFFDEDQIEEIKKMVDFDSLYLLLSNLLRRMKGKKDQKKPLQKMVKLTNDFFGIKGEEK
jgi:hypothetical protein